MYTCVRHITYRERERERGGRNGKEREKTLKPGCSKARESKRKCFNPLTEVCYTIIAALVE